MSDTEVVGAITDLVRRYIAAMTTGDRADLERIFFENASEVGHFQGALLWNTRETFIGMCEEAATEAADVFWAIRSISVRGDIATVHVENDWAGMRFDDFLSLLNHDGAWRIVSKVYHVRG